MHALEAEKKQIEARLDTLRKGKVKKITKDEREAVEGEWKRCCAVARKRDKIAKEMWATIEEGLPDQTARAELREMFDLDG